jgi:hypothetical protein
MFFTKSVIAYFKEYFRKNRDWKQTIQFSFAHERNVCSFHSYFWLYFRFHIFEGKKINSDSSQLFDNDNNCWDPVGQMFTIDGRPSSFCLSFYLCLTFYVSLSVYGCVSMSLLCLCLSLFSVCVSLSLCLSLSPFSLSSLFVFLCLLFLFLFMIFSGRHNIRENVSFHLSVSLRSYLSMALN